MHRILRIHLGALLISMAAALPANELELSAEHRNTQQLVIYNTDLALFSEHYVLDLKEGHNSLKFTAISPMIDPTSAVLYPLPDAIRISGQEFQNPLNAQDLLARSVGQSVSLVRTLPDSGEQLSQRARILAVDGGLILEIDGRYETELAGRRIVYDKLPAGVLRPTLSVDMRSQVSGRTDVTLSYLSAGLSWSADYIVRLDREHSRFDLQAMASLRNYSGTPLMANTVELVAGSVNRERHSAGFARAAMASAQADSAASIKPVELGDLHLYRLPGAVILANNSVQQKALFEAREVPYKQIYRLRSQPDIYFSPGLGEQQLKVDSFIEFANQAVSGSGEGSLGVPMPAGRARLYARTEDDAGALRFIGEDRIDHTPKHATLELKTGQAFDLAAKRRQIAFKNLPVEHPYRQHSEIQVRTELSNAGDEAVAVEVREQFSGEWRLVDGPEPDTREARSAGWTAQVPANGTVTLGFTVRVKR